MAGMSDPRAVRSRARILEAAREMMSANGPESVTFASVADRAGVGRATVYRHWPSVDALRDEVMDEFSLPFFRDPQQPLQAWLHRELRRLADELRTPAVARMATALIGDDRDAPRRDRLFGALEQRLEAALGTPASPGRSECASLLIGPLLYLSLAKRQTVSDEWITQLITLALGQSVPGERSAT
jgi:AcrR family transcriptional regulator